MRRILPLIPALILLACDDSDPAPTVTAPALVSPTPDEAPAGQPLADIVVDVTAPDTPLTVTVLRGGGAVTDVRSGPDGTVALPWTLGVAPVDNLISVAVTDAPEIPALMIQVRGTLAEPLRAEPFADVHAFLDAEGYTGNLESTEDLAFGPDGLFLGAPGGLLHVAPDGAVSRRAVDPGIERLWGFAFDAAGDIWGVDIEGDRMVRIAPDGTYEGVLDMVDGEPLEGPNYVAVDHDGRVYLTDPCRGEIIRLDPATGDMRIHTFDLVTEGGPNGLAVSADGAQMYVATENTGILCGHVGRVDVDAEIAGVYVIELDDFETRQPLAEGIALFGDGLALDVDGNLYVVADWQANFQLERSAVVVFPAGESEGTVFLVADEGQVFANVAFGAGEYGATTLYIALLAIPGFTDPDSRGLERFEVGIAGLPLLPR